ncbi:IS1182 family transposase [Streptomyces sp. KR55]|uniref:IS1182 family transposase n=1 Tax=Streptomyces sp. KR55 TaxID=3457425 RepID=UPI003FD6ACE6
MSLRPGLDHVIPAETVRVAWAAFPKGTLCIRIRDALGPLFANDHFQDLFPVRGRPALPPWRLALVSVLQFAEGLSDRQAADAVRARIDWKYALSLPLEDAGFDFSVLSEFRSRLLKGPQSLILDLVLERLSQAGLLAAGGRQRTDSAHVLAAVRTLNRLELVIEAMRAALEVLATAVPDWLTTHLMPAWPERYGRRAEEYRLPMEDAERLTLSETVGADGADLLALVEGAGSPSWLRELPAIQSLRRIWDQHYDRDATGRLRWRTARELPSAGRCASPYDPDARYGIKRNVGWTGYKAHLTETCEPNAPHLIVNVATDSAGAADNTALQAVHATLATRDLLPDRHLVDSAYTGADLLATTQAECGIELFGPMRPDSSWQAKAQNGFAIDGFQIDWDDRVVHCPRGKTSIHWSPWRTKAGEEAIHVEFSKTDCTPCPSRPQCTRAKREPRQLTLHQREIHEALHGVRAAQETTEWKEQYAMRAGIEGTLSQAVRAFGLRRCRYRGTDKTNLQHVLTAAAINIVRADAWLIGTPHARTRTSRIAALQTAAA